MSGISEKIDDTKYLIWCVREFRQNALGIQRREYKGPQEHGPFSVELRRERHHTDAVIV